MKLHRHKPELCLLSADTAPAYKIIIVDAILYVKKIELTPSVFNAINTVLNDKNAQYAITRTTPEVFTVPRGQQSQHIDNAFLGEIPKYIAVCMMDNDSYNGNYEKNPFNFQHYNLDSNRNISQWRRDPIQATETQLWWQTVCYCLQHFILRYRKTSWREKITQRDTRLLLQTWHHLKLVITLIWKQREHWTSIWFSKVLSQLLINVLVYAEYDNVIEIDSNRNVIKDWSN